MLKWLKDRLKEKSTQAAIIGLLPVIFRYGNVPEYMIEPLVNVVSVFLISIIVTKG